MVAIHVHEQKLGQSKDNLPEQAYEPSNQQQNPILLKAKLSLDFWNLWTFDTEQWYVNMTFQISFKMSKSFSIRIWGSNLLTTSFFHAYGNALAKFFMEGIDLIRFDRELNTKSKSMFREIKSNAYKLHIICNPFTR